MYYPTLLKVGEDINLRFDSSLHQPAGVGWKSQALACLQSECGADHASNCAQGGKGGRFKSRDQS